MSATGRFSSADFEPVLVARQPHAISRPSLSYWQDTWRRLSHNRRAFVSLGLVAMLGAFALVGPFVWRVDPATQDVNQISQAPSFPLSALIVEPYIPWAGVVAEPTRPGNVVLGITALGACYDSGCATCLGAHTSGRPVTLCIAASTIPHQIGLWDFPWRDSRRRTRQF